MNVDPSRERSPASLWDSDDQPAWSSALERYRSVVAAQGVTRLVELDDWYLDALPGIIAARSPPFVTREELTRLTEWKMKRGVWRARNLDLVKANTDDDVRRRSGRAFELVPDPRKPVAELAELKGVGPATASAALSAAHPALYPFFDELVAEQVPDLGKVAFTIPYYLRYAARLRDRAAELHGSWTAQSLSQALWSHAGGKIAHPG